MGRGNVRWNRRLLGRSALALVLSACTAGERATQTTVVQDSSGVTITSVAARDVDAAPRWHLSAAPELVIGAPEEEGVGSRFYMVTGSRMLPDRGVLVVTNASKQYIAFDSDGELMSLRGRVGSGPGEFRHIQLMSGPSEDTLALFDAIARRVSVTAPTESPARQLDVRVASNAVGRLLPVHLFRDGRLLARIDGPIPGAVASGTVRQSQRLVVVNAALELEAELGEFDGDEMVVRDDPELDFFFGQPTPYGRALHVAVHDSLAIVSEGGPFAFRVFSSTGALRNVVRVGVRRRAVSDAMRTRYRDRVKGFMTDPYATREWTLLSSDDVFPDSLPAFDQMVCGRDGTLWFRLGVAEGDLESDWVAFDPQGLPKARLRTPAPFSMTDVTADAVLGVWEDDLGRQQLRRYGLKRS